MGVAPLFRHQRQKRADLRAEEVGMSGRARGLDFVWILFAAVGAIAIAGAALAETRFVQPADLSLSPSDVAAQPPRQTPRIVFVTGKVDAIDKNFFGRTQKVAIVSLSDSGALLQNPIENESAGEELKHHVGEDVTARGVVLVKADGSVSLLVDAFQVNGGQGGFVGDTSHSHSHREY
jgi:hypothetical protein